ncbi:MAG TPA: FMN-binding protein [Rectinemataceae bacterium]|nr:FMN-binding protein [Rectinemataceae bacterium]
MKKTIMLILALSLVAGSAFAQVSLAKVKDGVYFAQDQKYSSSGWKEQVVLTIKGGKIIDAIWNGVSNIAGAADKVSYATAGKYGMVKASKIKAEWDAQSKAVADYLVKTQDVNFAKLNKDGKTDAITGATMTVSGFFALVKEALSSAPVAKGSYKDGWYFAQQADFDKSSGWKDSALVTVVNGSIVDVVWNGLSKDPAKKSKIVEAVSGRYGMAKAAKKGEWNVQAEAVEAAIVKAGDPSKIALKADGTSDAVSGASIHLSVVTLAIEALKAAK